MAIQNRRGVYASLDKSKLVPGEIAVCTDNGKMFYCYSAGNVVEVTTAERLQEILEASSEAYTALQELIASLDGEGSTGAQILANIATLQAGVTYLNNNKADGSRKQFELSTKGWYRIVEFVGDNLSSTKGGGGNGLHLSIKSNYMNNVSSCVDVIINASYGVSNFTILGKQSVGVITKLRHTSDESTGKSYIEMYYAYDSLNVLAIEISSVKAVYENIGKWSVINPIATTEAISSDVTIYGSTDLTTNTNTVLTGANIVNNQSTTVTGFALDATQANPSIPGSLAERDVKLFLQDNASNANSESAINSYLSGLHSNVVDGTYYKTRASFGVVHSILGGEQYYIEGFRASVSYGWQKITSYATSGVKQLERSIVNGTWTEWVNRLGEYNFYTNTLTNVKVTIPSYSSGAIYTLKVDASGTSSSLTYTGIIGLHNGNITCTSIGGNSFTATFSNGVITINLNSYVGGVLKLLENGRYRNLLLSYE